MDLCMILRSPAREDMPQSVIMEDFPFGLPLPVREARRVEWKTCFDEIVLLHVHTTGQTNGILDGTRNT